MLCQKRKSTEVSDGEDSLWVTPAPRKTKQKQNPVAAEADGAGRNARKGRAHERQRRDAEADPSPPVWGLSSDARPSTGATTRSGGSGHRYVSRGSRGRKGRI